MELDLLVRDFVGRADPGGPGVVVVELPGRELAVRARAAADVDDARGTEVGPGELFFSSPHDLHRTGGGARQPRGLDGDLARVLAAVAGSRVGHDHADLVLRDPKGLRQLAAHAEGALRSRPHRQRAVLPLGDRRPRLQRRVRDVGHGVRGGELRRRGGQRVVDRARHVARPRIALVSALLQEVEELGRGGLRRRLPFRAHGVERTRGQVGVRRRHAHEVAVADGGDAGHRLRGPEVRRDQRGSDARRPQHAAVDESRTRDVRGVLVPAGHDVAPVELAQRLPGHRPFLGRRGGRGVRHRLHELLALAQLAEARGAPAGRMHDGGGLHDQRAALERPALGREVEQHLARGGGDLAELRGHDGRGAAAEGAHVEGRERRVGHDQRDGGDAHAQLFRHHLAQRGADVLAHLRLAREDGHASVLADVQPGGEVGGHGIGAASPRAGFLGPRGRSEGHDEAGPEEAEEVAPVDLEPVGGRGGELVPLDLDGVGVAAFGLGLGPISHGSPSCPRRRRAGRPRCADTCRSGRRCLPWRARRRRARGRRGARAGPRRT